MWKTWTLTSILFIHGMYTYTLKTPCSSRDRRSAVRRRGRSLFIQLHIFISYLCWKNTFVTFKLFLPDIQYTSHQYCFVYPFQTFWIIITLHSHCRLVLVHESMTCQFIYAVFNFIKFAISTIKFQTFSTDSLYTKNLLCNLIFFSPCNKTWPF